MIGDLTLTHTHACFDLVVRFNGDDVLCLTTSRKPNSPPKFFFTLLTKDYLGSNSSKFKSRSEIDNG